MDLLLLGLMIIVLSLGNYLILRQAVNETSEGLKQVYDKTRDLEYKFRNLDDRLRRLEPYTPDSEDD